MFGGIGANGALVLFDTRVTLMPSKSGMVPRYHVIPTPKCPWRDYCGIGHTEIVIEFASLLSPRAKLEAVRWKPSRKDLDYNVAKMMRLVELTEKYQTGPPTVGGLVDAVQLSKDGTLRWLDRKANCPEN